MNYSSQLKNILLVAYPMLQAISEEEMKLKSNPAKWSKIEILGHLIDSAYNNHQRFLRASDQDNLIFMGYDQDEWVIKNQYQNRSYLSVLELWKLSNDHIHDLIAGLPENLIQKRRGVHNFHQICMTLIPEKTPAYLGHLIWDYNYHLEHHLSQILTNYPRIISRPEI